MNELTTFDPAQLPVSLNSNSKTFLDLVKGKSFVQQLRLYSKGEAVSTAKIPPGHYGVKQPDDTILDLGTEVDIIPLACRAKAMDIRDLDALIINFDPDSQQFKDIKAKADAKELQYLYGPTFLVFERSTEKFYELFCTNASFQREARNIALFLPKNAEDAARLSKECGRPVSESPSPCTLTAQYVKKPKFSWHAPVCTPCSMPFTNLPEISVVVATITDFMNQKSSDLEKVEPISQRVR